MPKKKIQSRNSNHVMTCIGKKGYERDSLDMYEELDRLNDAKDDGEFLIEPYTCLNCDRVHLGHGKDIKDEKFNSS